MRFPTCIRSLALRQLLTLLTPCLFLFFVACGSDKSNGGGTTTSTATDVPIVRSFKADPATISTGQSSTLSWSVANATSVSIDQGVGAVTGTSTSVSPAATTIYTLTATGPGGTATASATVTVTLDPIIRSFIATPSNIHPGETSTLSWAVDNADTLSISPTVGDVTGTTSATATPAANTTYTLTATNTHGSVTATAIVTVNTYVFPDGPEYNTQNGTSKLSRTTQWDPGVHNADDTVGIPRYTTVCATLSPKGSKDDEAINAAIEACPAKGVVKLNPGTYSLSSTVLLNKSEVVLRGSGGPGAPSSQQTRLVPAADLIFDVVSIGSHQFAKVGSGSVNCTRDAMQGTKTVTVSSAASFQVGDMVYLDMLIDPANDTTEWLYHPPTGGTELVYPFAEYNPYASPIGNESRTWFGRANRPLAQVMEIASISGSDITFTTPFHMTFDVGHSAQLTPFTYDGDKGRPTPVHHSGLEDLYVSGVPSPGRDSQNNNITLNMAKNCWVRNVESDQSNGYSIGIDGSMRCEVRDCYIHSTVNPTPGGAGYGLEFAWGSADNLAENNISWNFDKVMVMRTGGGGNVMGYNYMDDGWILYAPDFVESGMNAAHMATAHFELFEGNLTFAMSSDPTWGNNIFITWLRNLATAHRAGWPPLNTFAYNVDKDATCTSTSLDDWNQPCVPYLDYSNRQAVQVLNADVYFNYVGNTLGTVDMPTAPPQYFTEFIYEETVTEVESGQVPMWSIGGGQLEDSTRFYDPGVLNTLFRDGNYDYATKTTHWQAATQTLPASLYLRNKPTFFGSYTWPWVDGSNASDPYMTMQYQYYPLTAALGTPATSGTMVSYAGYQLPAFVRFLQLAGIVAPPASCALATMDDPTADCQLLLTGTVPAN